jgi:hypothetical protein
MNCGEDSVIPSEARNLEFPLMIYFTKGRLDKTLAASSSCCMSS